MQGAITEVVYHKKKYYGVLGVVTMYQIYQEAYKVYRNERSKVRIIREDIS